jgi:hypothetical protein
MVVTSDSGTDPSAPEVDFCRKYGRGLLQPLCSPGNLSRHPTHGGYTSKMLTWS